MASATLENWVDNLQASGKYAFLRREALAESGLSGEAVKKALQRLASRGRIAKAKDYFFVVVPLEYATAGGPPASWFIHDLMAGMERSYYVGLLTAAGLHGAARPRRSTTGNRDVIPQANITAWRRVGTRFASAPPETVWSDAQRFALHPN
jgi:hypothetical protein